MKQINFHQIGNKLREIRLQKGLTQEYIAYQADVNTSHICNIENNRVKISLQTLVAVCNALNVTLDYVLFSEYTQESGILEREILKELQECETQTKEKILKIISILK